MKNLMNKIRKSNKGFTLVELIIVVAIIAVLAAVAAPQYIKYLEKSRQGADANCVSEIAHAAEVAMVGDGVTAPTDRTVSVVIGSNGAFTYGTTPSNLSTFVDDIVAPGSYTFKSDLYKGKTIAITVNATTGKGEWTAPTPTT